MFQSGEPGQRSRKEKCSSDIVFPFLARDKSTAGKVRATRHKIRPSALLTYSVGRRDIVGELLHAPRGVRLIAAGNVDDDDESLNRAREREGESQEGDVFTVLSYNER